MLSLISDVTIKNRVPKLLVIIVEECTETHLDFSFVYVPKAVLTDVRAYDIFKIFKITPCICIVFKWKLKVWKYFLQVSTFHSV